MSTGISLSIFVAGWEKSRHSTGAAPIGGKDLSLGLFLHLGSVCVTGCRNRGQLSLFPLPCCDIKWPLGLLGVLTGPEIVLRAHSPGWGVSRWGGLPERLLSPSFFGVGFLWLGQDSVELRRHLQSAQHTLVSCLFDYSGGTGHKNCNRRQKSAQNISWHTFPIAQHRGEASGLLRSGHSSTSRGLFTWGENASNTSQRHFVPQQTLLTKRQLPSTDITELERKERVFGERHYNPRGLFESSHLLHTPRIHVHAICQQRAPQPAL